MKHVRFRKSQAGGPANLVVFKVDSYLFDAASHLPLHLLEVSLSCLLVVDQCIS